MTRRVKLATALHRTLDQRGTVPGELESGTRHNTAPSRAVPTSADAIGTHPPCQGFGLAVVGRALSSAVYGVGYYSSFGIVFSAMALWHLLPLNNALGRGFREGGQAGRAVFQRSRARVDSPRSAGTGARQARAHDSEALVV